MRPLKRRAKLLTTKLSALQSQLETSKEIVDDANIEIQRLYDEEHHSADTVPEDSDSKELSSSAPPHDPVGDPTINESAADQPAAEKNASPEVKKMFKKIASLCHPDKIADLQDGPNKKRLQSVYQKARKALENNDFFDMLHTYQELGLEPPEITEEQLSQIENKINTIKQELNNIESTIAWHWYFAKSKEVKQKILKRVFEALNERRKNNTGA